MNELDRLTTIGPWRERGLRWTNESVWGERDHRAALAHTEAGGPEDQQESLWQTMHGA